MFVYMLDQPIYLLHISYLFQVQALQQQLLNIPYLFQVQEQLSRRTENS